LGAYSAPPNSQLDLRGPLRGGRKRQCGEAGGKGRERKKGMEIEEERDR